MNVTAIDGPNRRPNRGAAYTPRCIDSETNNCILSGWREPSLKLREYAMRMPNALMAVSALMLIGTLPAMAAPVTDDVTFSATSFSGGAPPLYTGGTAPTDPVTGSFTITFDPTKTYLDSTTGITLGSLNIALGSALSFDYSPNSYTIGVTTFDAGELVVGGLDAGACCVELTPSTFDDFYLQILNFASTPAFNQLGYTIAANGDYFYSATGSSGGSVSVTPVSATPLPAALPLFATGLGAMGLFGWRRKRKAPAAVAAV
jgi:hypothetical protein